MILGIEILIFQVISMPLVGLIVLDVRDQGMEVERWRRWPFLRRWR